MVQRDRERALKALNTFATEITDYEERGAVCERAVEAAEAILDFDICVINLESDGILRIEAISPSTPAEVVEPMALDEGLAGLTYRTKESYLVDDLQAHDAAKAKGTYRSAVSVPVGDHGIFQTVAEERGAYDEADLELIELLVAHCAAALDHIEHTEEIRERTRRLEHQNRRLDRFANVVSHDLRNPISVMEGYLDLAEETGDQEYFEKCHEALDRMRTLTEDLLTLAREGSTVEELQPVSLEAVASTCWETVRTDAAALDVEDDYEFMADPDRARQVFENLFRNAVEHSSPDPREAAVEDGNPPKEQGNTAEDGGVDAHVRVNVGPLGDAEGFFIADDGPGIPAGERDEVFEPGMTTRDEGTGFGLSIVRTIAEAHGWSVDIAESEDGGARFEFSEVTPA